MASMAAQLLFNKNEQTEQKVKAEQQPNIAPATEEQVKNAIVEVVKCLDGELPLGAKAVAYIKKARKTYTFQAFLLPRRKRPPERILSKF